MSIDIAALRKVAKAATPGPWNAREPSQWEGDDETLIWQGAVTSGSGTLTWDDHGGEVFKVDDALHIATFDPPTVLALLDQLEELQWRLDGLDK